LNKARRVAKEKNFAVAGTLAILDQAATMKLINLPVVVKKLQSTSFWASERFIQKLLDKHS
jgi:predicted nucleic acid-binding protein